MVKLLCSILADVEQKCSILAHVEQKCSILADVEQKCSILADVEQNKCRATPSAAPPPPTAPSAAPPPVLRPRGAPPAQPRRFSLLDLGCGLSRLSHEIASSNVNWDVVGVDFSAEAIRRQREALSSRRERRSSGSESGNAKLENLSFVRSDIIGGAGCAASPEDSREELFLAPDCSVDVLMEKAFLDAVLSNRDSNTTQASLERVCSRAHAWLQKKTGVFVSLSLLKDVEHVRLEDSLLAAWESAAGGGLPVVHRSVALDLGEGKVLRCLQLFKQ